MLLVLGLKIILLQGWVNDMKELLKLQLRKLTKQKSLYICLAIMLALVLLSAVAYKIMMASSISLGDIAPELSDVTGIFFTLTTLSNADFFIILGIVVAITYCYDYEEHTVKNIFAKGYSRTSLFFSKVISILCATAFMFVCCFVFAFAVGTIFFGIGEGNLLSMLGLVGIQFLICLAYSAFFVFICTICKKMAVAIAINIVAPLVISLVLMLADSIVKLSSLKIAGFWLDGMITNLTSLGASLTSILIGVVGAVLYFVIFIICGAVSSKETEV